jgi:hypothetical protein
MAYSHNHISTQRLLPVRWHWTGNKLSGHRSNNSGCNSAWSNSCSYLWRVPAQSLLIIQNINESTSKKLDLFLSILMFPKLSLNTNYKWLMVDILSQGLTEAISPGTFAPWTSTRGFAPRPRPNFLYDVLRVGLSDRELVAFRLLSFVKMLWCCV